MSHLLVFSIFLCLIAGAALDTSNICLVRAARDLGTGKPGIALGILLVTASASVVFYLNAVFALAVGMPGWVYPDWITVAGAVIYAFGSIINGACAIGTIGRIARGDLGHLATFGGALAIAYLVPHPKLDRNPAAMAPFGMAAWLGIVLGFTGLMMLLGRRHLRDAKLGSYLALGLTAAVLTNWRGNVTWLGVVQQLQDGVPVQYEVLACLLAVFAGAAFAARFWDRFRLIRPDPWVMLREGIGGALMLFGAILIPGANDALSVYGVPSGSPNAVTGFVVMFAVMVAVLRLRGLQPGALIRPGAPGRPPRPPGHHTAPGQR
jgi:hypothetical protein